MARRSPRLRSQLQSTQTLAVGPDRSFVSYLNLCREFLTCAQFTRTLAILDQEARNFDSVKWQKRLRESLLLDKNYGTEPTIPSYAIEEEIIDNATASKAARRKPAQKKRAVFRGDSGRAISTRAPIRSISDQPPVEATARGKKSGKRTVDEVLDCAAADPEPKRKTGAALATPKPLLPKKAPAPEEEDNWRETLFDDDVERRRRFIADVKGTTGLETGKQMRSIVDHRPPFLPRGSDDERFEFLVEYDDHTTEWINGATMLIEGGIAYLRYIFKAGVSRKYGFY